MAKWLLGCECSGRIREALRARGHEVWSVDLDPAEDGSPFHVQGDVLEYLDKHATEFDGAIFNPPCTYLANSGVRWLYTTELERNGPDEYEVQVRNEPRWRDMEAGAAFFAKLLLAPIPKVAVENPIMHKHARAEIERILHGAMNGMNTHFVQPWWFGDPAFKATGFTLKGLPPLAKDGHCLVPPKRGTPEYKEWSVIHNMAPSATRAKDRSRTFPGVARAVAEQWG